MFLNRLANIAVIPSVTTVFPSLWRVEVMKRFLTARNYTKKALLCTKVFLAQCRHDGSAERPAVRPPAHARERAVLPVGAGRRRLPRPARGPVLPRAAAGGPARR